MAEIKSFDWTNLVKEEVIEQAPTKPPKEADYPELVKQLQADKTFMSAFDEVKSRLKGGINFLKELDITYVGKENKIKQVATVLEMKRNPICLLVGDAGEGKTTLVKKLTELVNTKSLGLNIDYRYIILQVNILKMKAMGNDYLLNEMENIIRTVRKLEDKAKMVLGNDVRFVAFFDEAHKLVSAFGNNNKLGGDALKEGLTPADVKVIACTTRKEYMETISLDEPLDQRFEVVQMDRLTDDEVVSISQSYWNDLVTRPPYYNAGQMKDLYIRRMVSWGSIYLADKAEPRRTTKMLELLEAYCRTHKVPLNLEAVKQIFRFRGFEVDLKPNRKRLSQAMSRLSGQELVKMQVDEWQYGLVAQAGDRGKLPVMVAFATGPTGVGKTEFANILGESYYEKAKIPLTVNIPQYASVDTGAEDMLRYIGKAVKNDPRTLILVDEVEKGAPHRSNPTLKTNVIPLFLDMLGRGIITYTDFNHNGRKEEYNVVLRDCIFVFTSNAGTATHENSDSLGDDFDFEQEDETVLKNRRESLDDKIQDRLIEEGIPPEFLGRMHLQLNFVSLGEYNGIRIAERFLDSYFSDLQEENDLKIIQAEPKMVNHKQVSGATKDFMSTDLAVFIGRTKSNMKESRKGGARQIKRVIEREVKNPIGKAWEEYQEKNGVAPKTITITVPNGGIDSNSITKAQMGVTVICS